MQIRKPRWYDEKPPEGVALPPGWEPKPIWHRWWPLRAWRWLTGFYWIYGPRYIPWWKESKNPAPSYKISGLGEQELLRYNIPITKIIEDNTLNDIQDIPVPAPPRRYIQYLLSSPWHPRDTRECDVLDWGLYSQGEQLPFVDVCVSLTVTCLISEENYQCLLSHQKKHKNT